MKNNNNQYELIAEKGESMEANNFLSIKEASQWASEHLGKK